jgi:hypothetical protein
MVVTIAAISGNNTHTHTHKPDALRILKLRDMIPQTRAYTTG